MAASLLELLPRRRGGAEDREELIQKTATLLEILPRRRGDAEDREELIQKTNTQEYTQQICSFAAGAFTAEARRREGSGRINTEDSFAAGDFTAKALRREESGRINTKDSFAAGTFTAKALRREESGRINTQYNHPRIYHPINSGKSSRNFPSCPGMGASQQ
ncbi:hypothetical protein BH09BAC3_BH09BAC3_24400 [soil metagenome]